jgi:hypothetical protein
MSLEETSQKLQKNKKSLATIIGKERKEVHSLTKGYFQFVQ